VWVTLVLAVITTVLTPITIQAGNWLYDLRRSPDAVLQEHAELGDTMIYFSVALLVVALALVALRYAERRDDTRRVLYNAIVAVVAILVGVASIVQVYRIGDAGAQSVWSKEIAHLTSANQR
jgi:membrane protein required for beta-lactamase induction